MTKALLLAALLAGCHASTARDPDRAFITEWGPTAYNAAGAPDGHADCGPSSLVMAGAYFQLLELPTAATALAELRRVRGLTRGGEPAPQSGPTFVPMMKTGAAAIGMTATSLPKTAAAVVDALDRGAVVAIAGDPRTAWGLDRDAAHAYLHHYGAPGPIPPPADGKNDADHFGHWVLAFGRAADGGIVIGDPLSKTGTFAVTPAQIDLYFAEWPAKSAALALVKR